MTETVMTTPELELAHQDHLAWSEDLKRWEAEHTAVLGSLQAIMTHFEDHASEIQRQQEKIAAHDAAQSCRLSQPIHKEEAKAHDRFGKRHAFIIDAVERLKALIVDPRE